MIKKIRRAILLTLVMLLTSTTYLYFYIIKDLPDYRIIDTQELHDSTVVYSINQNILTQYSLEKRIFVPFNKIPKVVIDAFLSAEDKNFFNHSGIDPYSLIRAFIHNIYNIKNPNKSIVGGSTITQQLVKLYLLTPEKSIKRKLKEVILAYQIDKALSKERILELYLNKIFLGNNSYGIAAAARQYFNKQLSDLDISEAALLAALPKAPTSLNPYLYHDKVKARRDWVIKKMLDNDYISEKDYIQHTSTMIRLHKSNTGMPGYYATLIRNKLSNIYDQDAIYLRGLRVHTYLDDKMQKIAESVFYEHLKRYDSARPQKSALAKINIKEKNWKEKFQKISKNIAPNSEITIAVVIGNETRGTSILLSDGKTGVISNKDQSKNLEDGMIFHVFNTENDVYKIVEKNVINGSMVVMQAYTGKVLAMIGGRGDDHFNRAIQAKRQPGSAFKTFIYLSAIENGLEFDTKVIDEPIVLDQGYGLEPWVPKNYEGDFLGEITLEEAFIKSRNIPTVSFVLSVGLDKVKNTIERFGIYNRKELKKANYSIALGAYELSLLDITNAYNTIASNGYMSTPRFISKIYDKEGSLLYEDTLLYCDDKILESVTSEDSLKKIKICRKRIIEEEHVTKIQQLLHKVTTHGTARRLQHLGLENIGGKTGTTNNSHDAWFIGIVGDITIGIHVGYDIPKSIGEKASGASIALPIFVDFVNAIIKEKRTKAALSKSSSIEIMERDLNVETEI